MKRFVIVVFCQGLVVGAGAMNAFWQPTPITIGLLPAIVLVAAYTLMMALRAA